MSYLKLPYITKTSGAVKRLAIMAESLEYLERRFADVMGEGPTNTAELYEALSRVVGEVRADSLPLRHAGEELINDQIHRWILGEDSDSPLACGHVMAALHRTTYYFPRIGRVSIYPSKDPYPWVRFSFSDPSCLTLIPEEFQAWEWKGEQPRQAEGGLPRGIADFTAAFTPTLRCQDDEWWGDLDFLGDPAVEELLRPSEHHLYSSYYQLDFWRVGITAEWLRLARKWCPRLAEDDWLAMLLNRYEPISTTTIADPDRLVALALVLMTRLLTASSVATHLERSPDYTFLTGLLSAAVLHSHQGYRKVLEAAPSKRCGHMLAVVEFYQDHLRPKSPLDMDLLEVPRPILRNTQVDWELYDDQTNWPGAALHDLLGDLSDKELK